MPNSIAKFKKYVPLLDEVYKLASLTSVLDSDASLAQEGANANEIIIPKIDMDALGDYDRNSGYTNGDVTMTNETVKFNYERGRMFSVDAMDIKTFRLVLSTFLINVKVLSLQFFISSNKISIYVS